MYEINIEIERKEILRQYRKLLTAWSPIGKEGDNVLIKKAFKLAVEAHKDMRRKSGEPYIYHPIAVAQICVSEIGLGTTSVLSALLHDVVEDTDYTIPDIEDLFGQKVASIVDGLTKFKGIFDKNTVSEQAENYKKILLTLSDDVRVIIIKIADRLHNMRTLEFMPFDKKQKICSETVTLFAPLAHRLGLYSIKSELEDLAFKYQNKVVYESVSSKLKETEAERNVFINEFIYPIKKELSLNGFKTKINGRIKTVYSIFQKLKAQSIEFEDVYDLFAIRIIIDVEGSNISTNIIDATQESDKTLKEKEDLACWRVYAAISNIYSPIHERTRDWLKSPKANGYEALHMTVNSLNENKPVEIQIRTKRMDEIAEKGFAAHWKYKSNIQTSEGEIDEWLNKVREVLQNPTSDALSFLDNVKLTLWSHEIYAFTPKNKQIPLPMGATVLDFAYNIHTDLGNKCIGAKVNYKLEPNSFVLKTGDKVEVITSKNQKPHEEWLKYVITAKSKTCIAEAIREERKKYSLEGKTKLEEIFNVEKIIFNANNVQILKQFTNTLSSVDLYFKIAQNIISRDDIILAFDKNEKKSIISPIEEKRKPWSNIRLPFFRSKNQDEKEIEATDFIDFVFSKANNFLLGEDMGNIRYSVSQCCKPIPGDMVIGIITHSEGIKVHRVNCEQAIQEMSIYGNRIIKAKWRENEVVEFLTGLSITGIDKKGIINEITSLLLKQNINIRSFHLNTDRGKFIGEVMIYVHDTKILDSIISELKKNPFINHIERIDSEVNEM